MRASAVRRTVRCVSKLWSFELELEPNQRLMDITQTDVDEFIELLREVIGRVISVDGRISVGIGWDVYEQYPRLSALLSLACLRLHWTFTYSNTSRFTIAVNIVITSVLSRNTAESSNNVVSLEGYEGVYIAVISSDHCSDEEDIAYAVKTSGSTSPEGKCIRVTRSSVDSNLLAIQRQLNPHRNPITGIQVSPPTFDPSIVEISLPFLNSTNGRLIVPSVHAIRSPTVLFETIQKEQVSLLMMTPSLWMSFSRLQRMELTFNSPAITDIVLGGEAYPLAFLLEVKRHLEEWRGQRDIKLAQLWNIYGTTECSIWASMYRLPMPVFQSGEWQLKHFDSLLASTSVPLGHSLDDTVLQVHTYESNVIDEDQFVDYPGTEGYLWIGGEKRRCLVDKETEAKILRNTGDLVSISKEGRLEYLGREDWQVKRFGNRIDCSSIALSISQHCSQIISQCIVIYFKQQLMAILFVRGPVQLEAIYQTLNELPLPYYAVPDAYYLTLQAPGPLPTTAHGKLDVKRMAAVAEQMSKIDYLDLVVSPSDNNYDIGDYIRSIYVKLIQRHQPHFSLDAKEDGVYLTASGATSIDAFRLTEKIIEITDVNRLDLLNTILNRPLTDVIELCQGKTAPPPVKRIKTSHNLVNCLWKVDMEKCIDATPVISSKSVAYVGSHSGKLSAIDVSTGTVIWSSRLGDRIEATIALNEFDSWLAVGCFDGGLYILDMSTGECLAQFKTFGEIKATPVISNQKIWFASYDMHLYCASVNRQTKSVKLEFSLPLTGNVKAAPLLSDSTLYVTTTAGHVLAISDNVSDNELLWETIVDKPIFTSPVLSSKVLLIIAVDGTVVALDSLTGQKLWEICGPGPVFSSPVQLKPNVLIYGTHSKLLQTINTASKEFGWNLQLPDNMASSVTVSGDLIIACSIDGTLSIVDVNKKRFILEHQLDGPVFSTPVLVKQNGTLQVLSMTEPIPKTIQSMSLILQSMGVEDAEPRVAQQLLELTFRTTLDFLDSAQIYAEHAGHDEITVEDVKLAIETKIESEFTGPPPRELLAEIAAERNQEPMPIISEKFGVRLPKERYCLTQPNYQVLGLAGIPQSREQNQAVMDGISRSVSAESLPAVQPLRAGEKLKRKSDLEDFDAN